MGRPGKPIEIQKGHHTKAEIAARRAAELSVTVVDGELVCPPAVKDNFQALKKWHELQRMHFLTPVDASHLSAYCMAWAEYQDLLERLKAVSEFGLDWKEEAQVEGDTYTTAGERAAVRVWKKMDYILSQEGILKINAAINAKLQILTQMSDRLFLNPRSRAIVPKKEKAPENPLQAAGFGNL